MSFVLAERSYPYYGAKLEPRNKCIHGWGQGNWTDVGEYRTSLGNIRDPLSVADYWHMGWTPPYDDWFDSVMVPWFASFPHFAVLQFGVMLGQPGDIDKTDEIADGYHDSKFEELFASLATFGKYCYLRFGYECNGSWNGYNKTTYIAAYQRVVGLLRASAANNITANCWCIAAAGDAAYIDWYPGDSYVDWWGLDILQPAGLSNQTTIDYLAEAAVRRKPVCIGETTCYGGVTDAMWTDYFTPFFGILDANRHVKMFNYINWDWNPVTYPGWGDARLSESALVETNYRAEMGKRMYLHGSTQAAFEAAL